MKIKSSFTHSGVVLLHYAHLSFQTTKGRMDQYLKKYISHVFRVYTKGFGKK